MRARRKEELQGLVIDALKEIKEENLTPEERIASRIINPAEVRTKPTSKWHAVRIIVLVILFYVFIGSIFFLFLYTSLTHPVITFLIPITGFVVFIMYKQWFAK